MKKETNIEGHLFIRGAAQLQLLLSEEESRGCARPCLHYKGWARGHAVIARSSQQITHQYQLLLVQSAWRSFLILNRNISCSPAARVLPAKPGSRREALRAQHPSGSLLSSGFNLVPSDSDSNLFSLSRTICLVFSSTWKSQGTVHKLKCLHREGMDGAASAPPLVTALQRLG